MTSRNRRISAVTAAALCALLVLPAVPVAADPGTDEAIVNLININDFHGRINANTVKFAGTIEGLKAQFAPEQSVFLSAGDNIGATEFASSAQQDQPTIDVLNALGLAASAVGNHEFDQGFADLRDRVIADRQNAAWAYLGANVYHRGTVDPALAEYEVLDVDGLRVAVIGAVTRETGTLVSPAGIAALDFGDPVAAVNRVAERLSDGVEENGEADLVIVEYHEGALNGSAEGGDLEQQMAADAVFARLVRETSPAADVIFTGHTHRDYVWNAPVPGRPDATRPIIQAGNYGERIGQVTLRVDRGERRVKSVAARTVPRVDTPDAELSARYPAVARVRDIVAAARQHAEQIGGRPVAVLTQDVTRARNGTLIDDRTGESALGTLIANALRDELRDPALGGADIGVVNPGALRADLPSGEVTFAQANAVMPFLNNMWTTSLTGDQLRIMLEQQWQRDRDGGIPHQAYLQLGLSDNVNYTFDPELPEGSRITSITVGGRPVDPTGYYRLAIFGFLRFGGDNFTVFTRGIDPRDSGLIDRDVWMRYLAEHSPVAPDFSRRGTIVRGLADAAVTPGASVEFELSGLDMTSLGAPENRALSIELNGESIGTAAVVGGAATVSVRIPAGIPEGSHRLLVRAAETGTLVYVPIRVGAAEVAPPGPPVPETVTPEVPSDPVGAPGARLAQTGGAMSEGLVWALLLLCGGAALGAFIPRVRR